MNTIPQQAHDWLVSNPTPAAKSAFNAKFGDGQAESVLENFNNPQPEIEVTTRSWFDVTKSVVGDVAEGVLESPASIAGGLYEGGILSPADYLASTFGDVRIYNDRNGEFFDYVSPAEYAQEKKDIKAGKLDNTVAKQLAQTGRDTFTGNLIGEGSRFVGAFVGLGKVFKSGNAIMQGVRTGASTFAAYEGNEGRITDMLLEMGVPDEMLPDFLETDVNDSETMGRLKNVIEEGPLAAVSLVALKAFKAVRTGNKAEFDTAVEQAAVVSQKAKAAINERIDTDIDTTPARVDAPEASQSPDLTDTDPRSNDLDVSNRGEKFPEGKAGFQMTAHQHSRVEGMAAKLADNPDAAVGDMGWRKPHLISAPEQVEAEIASVAKVMATEFKKKNKQKTLESIQKSAEGKAQKLAVLTGQDPNEVIKSVKGFDNPNDMAAELMARENYALSLSQNITDLATALRQFKDAGDMEGLTKLGFKNIEEAKMAIVAQRELAANVIATVQGQRSNIGRAMRAMQVVRSGDDKVIQMLRKNDRLSQSADEIVDALDANARDGKGVLDVVVNGGKNLKKFGDAVNTYRINAMLSGIGTQEVNMVSNAINMFAIPTQQLVGGAVSLNGQQVSHALRTYRGIIGGSAESLKSSLRAAYNDDAILDPFNGKIDTMPEANSAKTFVGKIVQAPSRFLLTADEFFKQSQYRGRIYADALDEASRSSRVTSGKMSKQDFVNEYLKKSFDEQGAATRGEALLQAQRSTFTEDLTGPMSRMIQQAAIKSNIVRFFVPFVRTPLNILSQGFQQMPAVGFMSKRLRDDIAAGGPRRAQAIGKQVIGTSIAVIGFSLAANGTIVGSGPKDPRVRAQWLKNNKPYSFKFVDKETGKVKFVPYQRYEPAAYLLSLMADVSEIINYGDDVSRVEKEELVAATIMAVAENTINKTFTQGIADLFEMLTDTERAYEGFSESLAGSFVPNIIPQALDAEVKVELRGMADAVQSRMGFDATMDVKRNALGEPEKNYGSKMDPMNLVVPDERKIDIVQEELTRLSEIHQSGFSNPPSRMGEVDLKDITYKGDQSVYDRWLEMTSEIKLGGKTLRQSLEKAIRSRGYQKLSDGNRDFTGENEKHLKKIITAYRDAAKKTLIKQNKKFKDVWTEFETQKRLVKRRKSNTLIEDIINGSR